ncbi:MAG: carboxypeptidase-like regulatory domain-containing protein, partial [Acidobacteria bacterium]|nr:carboxypeptidase-like regulatory domain-containing protein [Acidobacteriota bacterium]
MLRSIFLFLLALPLLAQTGQIGGRVLDPSGAPVPAAQITVRNTANCTERKLSTANEGLYLLPLLPPGTYDVIVAVSGFKSALRSGVELAVDQKTQVDFTLEVGAVSERIEVTAAAAQLNTTEASQGQVIDNKRVVELPINGRYYGDLALLSAGTVQSAAGSRYNSFSSGGQRVTQNSYLLDGIDNNSVELAGAGRRPEMVQPSIDAVQEFKVQTNAYSAEFGRAMGAIINLTLKSGTNDVHGSAFEFLRNEKLDAKNFFTPATATKPPFKRNQYGFSIGGPVVIPKLYNGRNKTFFFADYEGTRIRETATIISTLPTARMRTGDFGELTRRINDPATAQPFPNNTIPAARLDPVSANLIKLYPNPQNAALANNYTALSPRWQDVDKWDVRIDQSVRSDTFFWRLSKQDQLVPDTPSLPAPAYGGGNLDFITEGYNTGAGWNHVFTPTLIASIRAGWNFTLFKRDNPASTNGELLNRKYGILGGTGDIPGGFSQLSITGYRALGIGGFNPVDRDSQNRQLSGDLTWIRGRHNVKIGAGVIKSQNNLLSARNAVGNYTFNSQYTTDGAADFLLGLASAWSYD